MGGYVVHQADVPMRANPARTEHYRTTLGKAEAPIDTVVGGWYTLGPGATNPLDIHTVPEIYFVTAGSALITMDGATQRITAHTMSPSEAAQLLRSLGPQAMPYGQILETQGLEALERRLREDESQSPTAQRARCQLLKRETCR